MVNDWEYWHPRNLFGIAKGVGIPICIVPAILNKAFGYYGRVLIEVGFTTDLLETVSVSLIQWTYTKTAFLSIVVIAVWPAIL